MIAPSPLHSYACRGPDQDRFDVSEDFELFSLTKIKSAKGLKALGGADAGADVTVDDEDEDDYQGKGGGANWAGPLGDDEEMDYVEYLDRELNAMYEDFSQRTRRRAVAQLAQDEKAPMSKKKRRAELNQAVRHPPTSPLPRLTPPPPPPHPTAPTSSHHPHLIPPPHPHACHLPLPMLL